MKPDKHESSYRGELEELVKAIEAALPDTININAVAYAAAMVLNRMMLGNGYTALVKFIPIISSEGKE